MQINISTRHGSVSDATREKIAERVEKLTRYFDRLISIDVTVDLERRDQPLVDLKVSAEHKHDFVAEVQGDDLMASLDIVVNKVEQQIRKYKQRIQDRHRGVVDRESETPSDTESIS